MAQDAKFLFLSYDFWQYKFNGKILNFGIIKDYLCAKHNYYLNKEIELIYFCQAKQENTFWKKSLTLRE